MVRRPKFNYKTAESAAGLVKLKFEKLPPKMLQLYFGEVCVSWNASVKGKEVEFTTKVIPSELLSAQMSVVVGENKFHPTQHPDPSWQENLQQKCIHTVSGFVADYSKLTFISNTVHSDFGIVPLELELSGTNDRTLVNFEYDHSKNAYKATVEFDELKKKSDVYVARVYDPNTELYLSKAIPFVSNSFGLFKYFNSSLVRKEYLDTRLLEANNKLQRQIDELKKQNEQLSFILDVITDPSSPIGQNLLGGSRKLVEPPKIDMPTKIEIANPSIGLSGFYHLEQLNTDEFFRWSRPSCSIFMPNAQPSRITVVGFTSKSSVNCKLSINGQFVSNTEAADDVNGISFELPDVNSHYLHLYFDFSETAFYDGSRHLGYAFKSIELDYD